MRKITPSDSIFDENRDLIDRLLTFIAIIFIIATIVIAMVMPPAYIIVPFLVVMLIAICDILDVIFPNIFTLKIFSYTPIPALLRAGRLMSKLALVVVALSIFMILEGLFSLCKRINNFISKFAQGIKEVLGENPELLCITTLVTGNILVTIAAIIVAIMFPSPYAFMPVLFWYLALASMLLIMELIAILILSIACFFPSVNVFVKECCAEIEKNICKIGVRCGIFPCIMPFLIMLVLVSPYAAPYLPIAIAAIYVIFICDLLNLAIPNLVPRIKNSLYKCTGGIATVSVNIFYGIKAIFASEKPFKLLGNLAKSLFAVCKKWGQGLFVQKEAKVAAQPKAAPVEIEMPQLRDMRLDAESKSSDVSHPHKMAKV